jgi:hypothetical protein
MTDILYPSLEELKKRTEASMRMAEKAIVAHPEAYREIKQILDRVVADVIDIGEYRKTAERLARLLEIIAASGKSSIFHYFYNNIDPRRGGDVRYFRAICTDLQKQIHCIDDMRRATHRLRLVEKRPSDPDAEADP